MKIYKSWLTFAHLLAGVFSFLLCCILLPVPLMERFLISCGLMLLHELGHLVVARILGYEPESASVRIFPFGGSFGLGRSFLPPIHDLLISFAGPLVNFAFAGIFHFFSYSMQNEMMQAAARTSLVLGAFNLIPAGFLDGGRILCTILSNKYSCYYAGLIVSFIGIVFGGMLAAYPLFSARMSAATGLSMLMGGFFIWSSIQEISQNKLLALNRLLHKSSMPINTRMLRIQLLGFSKSIKLLDIMKNFCFNKYYVIYMIDGNILRYNINEADLLCLFCKYGNIKLEECVYYTKEQEANNGKFNG